MDDKPPKKGHRVVSSRDQFYCIFGPNHVYGTAEYGAREGDMQKKFISCAWGIIASRGNEILSRYHETASRAHEIIFFCPFPFAGSVAAARIVKFGLQVGYIKC